MELLLGVNDEFIIVDATTDRISLRKKKRGWFSGTREETTITFPLSSVEKVILVPPSPFNWGTFTLEFDSDDNVYRKYQIRVKWKHREEAEKMFKILQHYINFT